MLFSKKSDKGRKLFERQALEHIDALYGTALRLTGSRDSAEDLVQDTYVRALRFWTKFDPGTNLRAWLFRMMFNLFVNQYRRSKRGREISEGHEQSDLRVQVLPDEHLAPTSTPEEFFFERLFSDDVVEAVSELAPDFKMVVLLADINGFSYKQIADILNIPVGTVMSRLHRGRRMLREKLYTFAVKEGFIRTGSSSEDNQNPQPADLNEYRRKRRSGEGN